MEVKRLFQMFSLLCILFILTACSFGKTEVVCTKETSDDNYKFNINITLLFNSEDVIEKMTSTAKYELTEKGKGNIESIKDSLDKKKERHIIDENVELSYDINDNIVTVNESIIFDDETNISDYTDLSASYIADKYKKDDILYEFKETGLSCK